MALKQKNRALGRADADESKIDVRHYGDLYLNEFELFDHWNTQLRPDLFIDWAINGDSLKPDVF